MIALDAAADVPEAGGKARVLARARRAGIVVPDGLVILPSDSVDRVELAERLAKLVPAGETDGREPARFAVRSSASVEDSVRASAAGVFESVIGVRAEAVAHAVARVRASATSEAARTYLAARNLEPARMAVLVQPLVRATRLGVLHTEPIDGGTVAAEERSFGEPEWGAVTTRRVPVEDPLARGALALAALLGAPADVEYALDEGQPIYLQARPLTTPSRALHDPTAWDPGDDAMWRFDAEHNPAPLSAAQASLVHLLDGLPGLPRQRVLSGYLYSTREGALPRIAAPSRIIPPHELPRVYAEEIAPACEAYLAPLEAAAPAADPDQLRTALAAFVEVALRYFGEVGPSLAAARRLLDESLREHLGEPLASHGALLGGTGGATVERDQALWRIGRADPAGRPSLLDEYARRFGASSPCWDVAVPTDDELPTRALAAAALVARGRSPLERQAAARLAAEEAAEIVLGRLARSARPALREILTVVRAALPLAEDDDLLFFRAQRAVRRPLWGFGRALANARRLDEPEQIFDLDVRRVLAGDIDVEVARGARRARQEAAHRAPPALIVGRAPSWNAPLSLSDKILRGAGVPGRARGRVFLLDEQRLGTGGAAGIGLPRGAILVAPALVPSLTYLLPAATALVTDHGGALSHGATLAREYGIPAVLGTAAATRALRDGEEVFVDGDAGRVYRLS